MTDDTQRRTEDEAAADVAGVDVDLLREEVRLHYARVAIAPTDEYHFHTGRRAALQVGYDAEILDGVPDPALEAFAGIANPFHFGLPAKGERVVDIGSGAGTDAMIAARAVGDGGSVIGVDMTSEMLELARRTASEAGINNIEFREGLAEELPVDDGWADLVISNGVLNLVPDKVGAYEEVMRVLRPGGRIQISDICVDKPVPESAKRDIDLWTG
ncbi:MAG: methyltransferase domain-containing protein [Acidobacteria bacterium]|nr:methyltransferase domain-containing protein [Acidobacteriota bacterium]